MIADPGIISLIPALPHSFVQIERELFSMPILPLIQEGLMSVTSKSMCAKNWFSSLSRKSMWTDHLDMTIAVDWDVNHKQNITTGCAFSLQPWLVVGKGCSYYLFEYTVAIEIENYYRAIWALTRENLSSVFANNKGTDHSACIPRSLISAFVIHLLESIISTSQILIF